MAIFGIRLGWHGADKTVVDKAEADCAGADKTVQRAKRISHEGVTRLKSVVSRPPAVNEHRRPNSGRAIRTGHAVFLISSEPAPMSCLLASDNDTHPHRTRRHRTLSGVVALTVFGLFLSDPARAADTSDIPAPA